MNLPTEENIRALLDLIKMVYYKGQQDALHQADTPLVRNTPLSDDFAIKLLMATEKEND